MKLIIVLSFLIITKFGTAQIRVTNTDLASTDSQILFRDLKNHITIEGVKDFTQHAVTIDGGMLSLNGSNKILVSNLSKDEVKITVAKRGTNYTRKIHTARFKAQEAGEPAVVLEEEYDDSLSNGQILNRTSLIVKLPNHNYGGDYQVAHFEISLIDSVGKLVLSPTFVSGKFLGKYLYDKVNSLPPGGKIYFTQVVLSYSDGGYKKYKDFTLLRK